MHFLSSSRSLGYVSFVLPLVRVYILGSGLGRGQKGELATSRRARTADRNRTVHNLVMIYLGRTRVMNKQKKKHPVTKTSRMS